jgi:hypothetical protein
MANEPGFVTIYLSATTGWTAAIGYSAFEGTTGFATAATFTGTGSLALSFGFQSAGLDF